MQIKNVKLDLICKDTILELVLEEVYLHDKQNLQIRLDVPQGVKFDKAILPCGNYDNNTHIWTYGNIAANTLVQAKFYFIVTSDLFAPFEFTFYTLPEDQQFGVCTKFSGLTCSDIATSMHVPQRGQTYYMVDDVVPAVIENTSSKLPLQFASSSVGSTPSSSILPSSSNTRASSKDPSSSVAASSKAPSSVAQSWSSYMPSSSAKGSSSWMQGIPVTTPVYDSLKDAMDDITLRVGSLFRIAHQSLIYQKTPSSVSPSSGGIFPSSNIAGINFREEPAPLTASDPGSKGDVIISNNKIYYHDGTKWYASDMHAMPLTQVPSSSNFVHNKIYVQDTFPTVAFRGDQFYDTTTGRMYIAVNPTSSSMTGPVPSSSASISSGGTPSSSGIQPVVWIETTS